MSLDLPSWVAALVAAVLGFVGAWAALRVTVAGLKDDVAALKVLLTSVTTLQAQTRAFEAEIERVRVAGQDNHNRLQELSERMARLEAREILP
jgi:hypothetical protein